MHGTLAESRLQRWVRHRGMVTGQGRGETRMCVGCVDYSSKWPNLAPIDSYE